MICSSILSRGDIKAYLRFASAMVTDFEEEPELH